ncbi:hypothetical protein FB451DRAFT_1185809 [Mycena latifolia]|nr:hypothetical protein FB451DRAFT_1185809 [Mycena latifolia]
MEFSFFLSARIMERTSARNKFWVSYCEPTVEQLDEGVIEGLTLLSEIQLHGRLRTNLYCFIDHFGEFCKVRIKWFKLTVSVSMGAQPLVETDTVNLDMATTEFLRSFQSWRVFLQRFLPRSALSFNLRQYSFARDVWHGLNGMPLGLMIWTMSKFIQRGSQLDASRQISHRQASATDRKDSTRPFLFIRGAIIVVPLFIPLRAMPKAGPPREAPYSEIELEGA